MSVPINCINVPITSGLREKICTNKPESPQMETLLLIDRMLLERPTSQGEIHTEAFGCPGDEATKIDPQKARFSPCYS